MTVYVFLRVFLWLIFEQSFLSSTKSFFKEKYRLKITVGIYQAVFPIFICRIFWPPCV